MAMTSVQMTQDEKAKSYDSGQKWKCYRIANLTSVATVLYRQGEKWKDMQQFLIAEPEIKEN